MGVGLPFAVGAKAARPEAQVICLHGDGSFGQNAMELDTAAERNRVGCRRENIRAKFYVANPRFNSPKSRSVSRSDNAEVFCRT